MQLPFFVYGTLRPGEHYHALIGWAVSEVQAAKVEGLELWDLGPYPMAVEGVRWVIGELLYIYPEHYEVVLDKLDKLEEVNPAAPTRPGGVYWRACCEARLHSAGTVQAWIYLGSLARARRGTRIVSGDWKQRPEPSG